MAVAATADLQTGVTEYTRATAALIRRERALKLKAVAVFLGLWELAGRLTNPLFLASPSAVAVAFVQLAIRPDGLLFRNFLDTMSVMAAGYVLAGIVGIVLGTLMGRSEVIREALDPFVTVLYNTPRVALIPILMLWLGLGVTMKATVVFLAAIFPVIVNTQIGVRDVSRSLIEPARSMAATRWQVLSKVVFPAALPFVVTGLKIGSGRALTSVIVAEFFVSVSGLGGMIFASARLFRTAEMLVPAAILALLGVALDNALSWVEERSIMRYRGSTR